MTRRINLGNGACCRSSRRNSQVGERSGMVHKLDQQKRGIPQPSFAPDVKSSMTSEE
jgi:hypothetical protein